MQETRPTIELFMVEARVTDRANSARWQVEVRLAAREGTPIHLFSWVVVAGGSSVGVFSTP